MPKLRFLVEVVEQCAVVIALDVVSSLNALPLHKTLVNGFSNLYAMESYDKEFEEKKAEYQVKVLELYESSSVEIKTLVKERKAAALKKYPVVVHKFLEELAKIGPVFYVFEKVSTYIVTEEKVEEPAPAKAEEETSYSKEKEIVIEEEKEEKTEEVVEVKKEEEVVEKKEEPEACVEEKPKVEEAAPACEEPAKP